MKIRDIKKWVVEIQQAEDFREKQFGKFSKNDRYKAGENVDYYEKGFFDLISQEDEDVLGTDMIATLNIVDPIVSIVTASLYSKNPRTIALPTNPSHEDTAPIAGKTIDFYRRTLEMEEVNKRVIWDAYVLGFGVCKLGYVTQFGKDIPDEEKQKEYEKQRSLAQKVRDFFNPKKKEEEVIRNEADIRIMAESPFVEYINPFDFGIDSRATSIYDARFVYHKLRKTLKEVKSNKKYKNTEDLQGQSPDVRTLDFSQVSAPEQEDFETIDVYEVHYRNEGCMYILVLADGNGEWVELYHEESVYDIGDWQFELLAFKKHGHLLYPRSDITKIKALQERITRTIDAILEQVDKLVPKIAYKTGGLTQTGKNSLENGGIGALVECNDNPDSVFKELNFVQVKADLQRLLDECITLISIQTGLTKAQLVGATDASSATEVNVEQGGQNLRFGDMSDSTRVFINRQSKKLWKVIKQFVPLEELTLINGVKGVNQDTGAPIYEWLTIDSNKADRLREGDYDFTIETGSTERVSLAMVRKSFENLFNILARTEVISLMQQQGDKVVLSEALRRYIDLFPELAMDASKFIQKIQSPTGGMVRTPEEMRGGTTPGSTNNAMEAMRGQPAPTPQRMAQAPY